LSRDHKLQNPIDIIGVRKQGSNITNERVNGILAVSKAVGDCSLKLDRTIDVFEFKHKNFIMINTATDGIYDVI